jgi:hypothetical protein
MQRAIGNKAIVEAEETKTIFKKLREEDRDRPVLSNTFPGGEDDDSNRKEDVMQIEDRNHENDAVQINPPRGSKVQRSWFSTVSKLWRAS